MRLSESRFDGAYFQPSEYTVRATFQPLAFWLVLIFATMIASLAIRFIRFSMPPVIVKYGGSMLGGFGDDCNLTLKLSHNWVCSMSTAG